MKRFFICLSLLSFLVLPISGCWDYKNIVEMLYVTAIGFDYKDKEFRVYAQVINFGVNPSGQSGPTSPERSIVGIGKGRTVNLAFNDLYRTSQRRISWSHIRSLVVTEDALSALGADCFDAMKRYREFRYAPWVYTTKGEIGELFIAQSFFDMSPMTTLMQSPRDTFAQSSWNHLVNLQDYQIDIHEPGFTTPVPILAIDKEVWSDEKKLQPKLKLNGVHVIYDNKLIGQLSQKDLKGERWMNPRTVRTPLDIGFGVLSITNVKPRISYQKSGGDYIFNVSVHAHGNIVEWLDNTMSESEIRILAEEKMAQEIRQTFETAISRGMDFYNFQNELFRHGVKDYASFRPDEGSLAQVSVRILVDHTGKLNLSETQH
jgi:Ger(x)C family germination protein